MAAAGGHEQVEGWPHTEQEESLAVIFADLAKLFKRLNKAKDPDKIHGMVKEVTRMLKEAKG
jgi:hypothetical protein